MSFLCRQNLTGREPVSNSESFQPTGACLKFGEFPTDGGPVSCVSDA